MRANDETRKSRKRLGAFWGRVLCVFGILLAVVGAYFVSVATEGVGIALGVAGYAFGARTLGITTIVLCVIGMFVGLLVGQGVIPGSYDEPVDGIQESIQQGDPR